MLYVNNKDTDQPAHPCSLINVFFSSPEPKAHWWAYRIGRPLSSVGRPQSLNIFSSETAWPIKVKFHMMPPWDGERKFVQMIEVTWPRWPPCPYMVKTLKNLFLRNQRAVFFSGTKGWVTLKLGMQHRVLEYYQVCSNDDPGLTWPILRQGQICSLMLLYGKKVKQWIFQKLL